MVPGILQTSVSGECLTTFANKLGISEIPLLVLEMAKALLVLHSNKMFCDRLDTSNFYVLRTSDSFRVTITNFYSGQVLT